MPGSTIIGLLSNEIKTYNSPPYKLVTFLHLRCQYFMLLHNKTYIKIQLIQSSNEFALQIYES